MRPRAGRIRRARHVRRRRRRRGRRDEPVRSSDADADAGRGEPVRGERERRRRWERKSRRDAVRTGDDDAGVAVRAAVDVGDAVRTAVDVGVDAVRTAVDVDAVRVDVVRGVRGRGRERGRGVVAVRAAELGGGGVVAVRASERRSVAVRTERGVVVAVRSDEWCVRFDVRVAVRRRIELAFRRERADADSVRNDDVGARRVRTRSGLVRAVVASPFGSSNAQSAPTNSPFGGAPQTAARRRRCQADAGQETQASGGGFSFGAPAPVASTQLGSTSAFGAPPASPSPFGAAPAFGAAPTFGALSATASPFKPKTSADDSMGARRPRSNHSRVKNIAHRQQRRRSRRLNRLYLRNRGLRPKDHT